MIIHLTPSQAGLVQDLLNEEARDVMRGYTTYPETVDALEDISEILEQIHRAEND